MKISAFSVCKKSNITDAVIVCCELMYRELFTWAQENNNIPIVNNSLLVHLGLIKVHIILAFICNIYSEKFQSEEKKYRPTWNLEGCFTVLEKVVKRNYFSQSTRNTLKVFLERSVIEIVLF